MAQIFLSYAREDRSRAATLAKLLESCGWSVFWDRNIGVGEDWRNVLQTELDTAGAVVVLWTQAAVSSSWVIEEAERGRGRLVSILLDEVVLPIGFAQLQAVDLVGWDGGRREDVERLVAAVAGTLNQPPAQPPRVPRSARQKRMLAAVVALAVGGVAAVLLYQSLQTPPPIMNQEIVIDTSRGMAEKFDTQPSKLVAAVEALRNRNLHPAENLALRAFGGPCQADNESRLVVSFGTSRRARIVDAASELAPNGEPTLVSGVISALADLYPLPHMRRVIVITGHADGCYEEAVRELKQRFDNQPKSASQQAVALEMRFIGLALSPTDESTLRSIGRAVGGDVYVVDTVAELNDVLQYVIEFEPAVAHVRNVWQVVDEVVKSLNEVVQQANGRKFDEANQILASGEEAYAKLRPSFEALAGVQTSAQFERFYALAVQNRAIQQEMFAAGRAWIRTGPGIIDEKAPDFKERLEQWNDAVAKWNEIIARYNTNANEMNRLTDEIVKQTRRAS